MLNIFSFLGWCRLSDILVTHAQNMFPSRAVLSLLLSLCLALLRFFRFETLLPACRETHGKVVHMNILEILQFTQSICQKVYIMRRWGGRVRFVYRGCWVKKIKKICVWHEGNVDDPCGSPRYRTPKNVGLQMLAWCCMQFETRCLIQT